MKLCGMSNNPNYENSTADYINNTFQDLEKNKTSYSEDQVIESNAKIIKASQDILATVASKKYLDKDNNSIDLTTVKDELRTLSNLLKDTIPIAADKLYIYSPEETINKIADQIVTIQNLSDKMHIHSLECPDNIKLMLMGLNSQIKKYSK